MLKLGDAGLDGLVQLLTPQHVTAGEVVFAQGSTLVDSCYFVESGELEVCLESDIVKYSLVEQNKGDPKHAGPLMPVGLSPQYGLSSSGP